ncbi:aldehyde:ferredoxin oxidoreductase [Methanocella sp. CWC-04]|uniref:Aldehyde:ferredoxin oxidoreductase n=1 Tax=Methanooceanicella nereidis TaxID=2052831 RepID=A0AAP2RF07_9EURY|nr:aldehyde ferredoxin oxidoreductase family protein [Methanocella sp. CWC-04]MCD1295007.1 aldehyde:ferredoxin oxidoreductase [Methanocella sp. CWC-04]
MPGGYAGKILRVELSTLTCSDEAPEESVLKDFIGGEGLGIKYLYDEVPAYTDPLGPDNLLIFMTGPLTGTLAPTSGRHCVVTKSPLTHCETTAHAGGYWGTELKLAGYDGIIVKGKSPRPVYLFINDGKPGFYEADELWGKTTFDTDRLIKEQLNDKKICVTSIGPAGENLVKIASIMNDYQRSASRGGTGAVMGSKNLKAIAVKGSKDLFAADPAKSFASMNELLDACRDHVITGDVFPKYGVDGIIGLMNEKGVLPTKNHSSGFFKGAENMTGQKMAETILKGTRGCFCCPIHCTRVIDIPYGPYHGTKGKGPDYDTTVAFGSQCGNDNLEAISRANMWCDMFGLDTVSTGAVIAWAMELYERGIINKEDTHGIGLNWGDHEAMVAMIPKIATRMELGAYLADGVEEAAKKIGRGSEKYALSVKKLDLPGIEVRGSKAMALGYAVDNRGGDNLRPFAAASECLGFRSKELGMPEEFDQLSEANKVEWLIPAQNYSVAVNSLVCCMFTIICYTIEPGQYAKYLSAVTGFDIDGKKLLETGDRIWNLQRAFNVREGIGRKDDRLPKRLTSTPVPYGPTKGSVVHLEGMLDEYYEARGWNKNTGWPTRVKLLSLGLENAARDLYPTGKEPGAEVAA